MKPELKKLIDAADVAVWAWAVKQNAKRRGMVDFAGAMKDLTDALTAYQNSNYVVVPSDARAYLNRKGEGCGKA